MHWIRLAEDLLLLGTSGRGKPMSLLSLLADIGPHPAPASKWLRPHVVRGGAAKPSLIGPVG